MILWIAVLRISVGGDTEEIDMTCNDKCIHYLVCEQKNWDFANINECKYYAEEQVVNNEKISCPKDLNQYLICEPIFENTFSPDECESRKFYGDCYHCFASSIAKRDRQIRQSVRPQGEWIIDGHHIRCNKCNEYICNTDREGDKIPDNFCPNCGADMRGG